MSSKLQKERHKSLPLMGYQLSFMRVKLPCRSSKCVHRQCFDATSWYAVNEQTTTWLCPVCERQLEDKDLIIDGYVVNFRYCEL